MEHKLKLKLSFLLLFLSFIMFISCGEEPTKNETKTTPATATVKIPAFSQDSAFAFIEKQLAFGPRVPGTEGHIACKNWLVEKFKSYGAEVVEQDFIANIYTGDKWPSTNIIAQFNPKKKKRVILSAHWDSRFIGEEDKDHDMKDKPIPGADDGGSGVGVLLEIGRVISENSINLGVDIILFDAEDQGERGANDNESWCLGSQYWSRNFHKRNYKAKFGVLLDMVGGKNPRFGKDQISQRYAKTYQDKIWNLAQIMGYSDMFINDNAGYIVDDHYFVNILAGIPMIDIINRPMITDSGFIEEWHTHDDDISSISKRTLRVVGQVVTASIYKESIGKL